MGIVKIETTVVVDTYVHSMPFKESVNYSQAATLPYGGRRALCANPGIPASYAAAGINAGQCISPLFRVELAPTDEGGSPRCPTEQERLPI